MLRVLLVNNALSAQARLISLIHRCGWQLSQQVSTLSAACIQLNQAGAELVLVDIPSQEETALSQLAEMTAKFPDTYFLFWVSKKLNAELSARNVIVCLRPLRLDGVLKQISEQAPELLQRSPKLKNLAEQIRQIAQAKRVLIESGMSEDEAHHTLEKMAMNQRISRCEAALQVIKTYQQE